MTKQHRLLDPGSPLDPARLPSHSFLTACGCGRPGCGTPTIEFGLLEAPERVLAALGATARNVRTYLADIAGSPHLYLILASDLLEETGPVERLLMIAILPFGMPAPSRIEIEQEIVSHLTAPFFNDGDELEAMPLPGRVLISGPASVLERPMMPVGSLEVAPDQYQA